MDAQCFLDGAYSEYMDDMNYSEGFYVTPGRGGSVVLGGVRPVEQHFGEHYVRARSAARFAVGYHNKAVEIEGGSSPALKFLRIVNLNWQPTVTAIYYITMEVADSAGERCYYQAKVWKKLSSGYKVDVFRRAPYSVKASDEVGNNLCCVGIDNLEPWMDENYLYYKCFCTIKHKILGVKVTRNDQSGVSNGALWLSTLEEAEWVLEKYVGKVMPCSNVLYDLTLI